MRLPSLSRTRTKLLCTSLYLHLISHYLFLFFVNVDLPILISSVWWRLFDKYFQKPLYMVIRMNLLKFPFPSTFRYDTLPPICLVVGTAHSGKFLNCISYLFMVLCQIYSLCSLLKTFTSVTFVLMAYQGLLQII